MVGEVVGGVCWEEGISFQSVEYEEQQWTTRGGSCGVDCMACEEREVRVEGSGM